MVWHGCCYMMGVKLQKIGNLQQIGKDLKRKSYDKFFYNLLKSEGEKKKRKIKKKGNIL